MSENDSGAAGSSKGDPSVSNFCYPEQMEVDNVDTSDEDGEQKSEISAKVYAGQKIPPHLKGLMGEANLRFARGECSIAEKMCFEVIRQCPGASEAYLTLAQLYENTDPEKSFQYNMIAAHLRPKDVDQWLKIAQHCVDVGNLHLALKCYCKAIHANPNNVELHKNRLEITKILGDQTRLLKYNTRLASVLNPKKHEEIIRLCLETAEKYHSMKKYENAIAALNIPFMRLPQKVTSQLVNLMLDLLLITKNYSKCLDMFLEFCDIELEVEVDENEKIKVISFNMPDKLLIDLKIKFIVCLVKLEAKDLIMPLIERLIEEEDVEQIGDLYLDVAEALMSMNWAPEALKLLVPLVKSKNFSLAAVWLKHAECLNACEMYEQAVDSYRTVMNLAPQHIEVRYPLSILLLKMGKKDEALKVLSQDPDKQELDAGILIKKMELLKQMEDYEKYYEAFELLLSRHSVILRRPEEQKAVIYWDFPSEKLLRIKKIREFYGEHIDPKPNFLSTGEPSVEEEFQLFRSVLQLCKNRGDYAVMEKFAFSAFTSTKLNKMSKSSELVLLAFFSSLYNGDLYHGYSLIKELLVRHPKNNLVCILFNAIVQKCDHIRYNRFLMRSLKNFAKSSNVLYLEGNYGLFVGNYNYAGQNLIQLFQKSQSPFLCLVVGAVMLQCCSQKFVSNKKQLTTTTLALFTHYANKRGAQALNEVKYNLGRLFHFFGMVHIAEVYYLEVLNYTNPLIEKHPDILDLKKEAAYNLHLIYRDSGNIRAARDVLVKHIVI